MKWTDHDGFTIINIMLIISNSICLFLAALKKQGSCPNTSKENIDIFQFDGAIPINSFLR
jgi:hypothetical protein